jgi:hypothetical protein
MIETPKFFVPGVNTDVHEVFLGQFAQMCDRPIPPPTERVYAIVFAQDGVEWNATVGEPLRGVSGRFSRLEKGVHRRSTHYQDPATVLAIFPGSPFMVVTDYNLVKNVHSSWENPISARKPMSVTYFSG